MKRIVLLSTAMILLNGCAAKTEDPPLTAVPKPMPKGEISCEVTTAKSSDMTSPVTAATLTDSTGLQTTVTVSEMSEEKGTDRPEIPTEPLHSTMTEYMTETTLTESKTTSEITSKTTVNTTQARTEPVPEQTAATVTEKPAKPEVILLHDGTDHGKAKAVYDYVRENGSGTCVNYSCMAYELCEKIGLPCFIAWTDSGIYGHVANVVCVDGTWYVLDTQGGFFLDYNYCFTEVVDIDGNHIADGDLISDNSY